MEYTTQHSGELRDLCRSTVAGRGINVEKIRIGPTLISDEETTNAYRILVKKPLGVKSGLVASVSIIFESILLPGNNAGYHLIIFVCRR